MLQPQEHWSSLTSFRDQGQLEQDVLDRTTGSALGYAVAPEITAFHLAPVRRARKNGSYTRNSSNTFMTRVR